MTSIRRRLSVRLLATVVAVLVCPILTQASETEEKTVSPVETAATSHSGLEMRALTEEARQYCVNIRDVAADARYAWQKSTLEELDKRVAERIAALEEKRAEYETWLKKREDFLAANPKAKAVDGVFGTEILLPVEVSGGKTVLVGAKLKIGSGWDSTMGPMEDFIGWVGFEGLACPFDGRQPICKDGFIEIKPTEEVPLPKLDKVKLVWPTLDEDGHIVAAAP